MRIDMRCIIYAGMFLEELKKLVKTLSHYRLIPDRNFKTGAPDHKNRYIL
jgi:hypothetical protein